MPRGGYIPDWQRALIVLAGTATGVVVVAVLFWAKSILIPVALAIFLTFVLSPAVAWFQRRGLGRTPAVVSVVGTAVLVAAGVGLLVAQQIGSLSATLPNRADEIKTKVASLKGWVAGNGESRFAGLVEDVMDIVAPKPAPPGQAPVPVVIESQTSPIMARVEAIAGPAIEVLGTAAFSFVLTVFMLLKKEDLRNRMIRLLGHGTVTTTTKAVDDASQRISRYLLTQLMLNAAFGVVITIGLVILGVHYALLWGFIAFLMRYVPYIGTWVGLLPPTLYALAVSEGPNWWWQPLAVAALFGGLELLCNNIFEPMLYGPSMGLSEVAQLVAAGFWAFLWGPIGLILSGPLTVVLLILGKYVRRLEFLAVLLGDEPALEPKVAFYQRLAARDQDEASSIALAEAQEHSAEEVFDAVVVPALCLAKRDQHEGNLSDDDMKFAVRAAREVGDEVADEADRRRPLEGPAADDRVPVVLCPARDEADRTAVELLGRLLEPGRWEVRIAAVDTLASELLQTVAEHQAAVVVIGSLPPGGLAHSRYLAARLRARFPEVKVVVGRWGRGDEFPDDLSKPGVTGADWVDSTLAETRKRLNEWYAVLAATPPATAAPADADGKLAAVGTAGASGS